MPTKINFIAEYELYYRANKKIKFNESHANELMNNIKSYSRLNSEGDIISYELGIIKLNDKKITSKNNYLHFEFDIDNDISTINDAEEAIYCIFEPLYSHNDHMSFTMEGITMRHYYKLKFLDVPANITIKKSDG